MLSVRTMIECLVFFQEDSVEVFLIRMLIVSYTIINNTL